MIKKESEARKLQLWVPTLEAITRETADENIHMKVFVSVRGAREVILCLLTADGLVEARSGSRPVKINPKSLKEHFFSKTRSQLLSEASFTRKKGRLKIISAKALEKYRLSIFPPAAPVKTVSTEDSVLSRMGRIKPLSWISLQTSSQVAPVLYLVLNVVSSGSGFLLYMFDPETRFCLHVAFQAHEVKDLVLHGDAKVPDVSI